MTARNPKSCFVTILSHVCKTTCILGCKTKYTRILSDPIHLDQNFELKELTKVQVIETMEW